MYNQLSNKVAELREVFPWPIECREDETVVPDYLPTFNLGEIVHSPEYCLDAMIRISKYLKNKQEALDLALRNLNEYYPEVFDEFESDRLGYIQNNGEIN